MNAHPSPQTQLRRAIILGDRETLERTETLAQQAAQHGAIIVEHHAVGNGEARSTGSLHDIPGVVGALARAIALRAHIWVPFPVSDLTREQHIRRLDLALERHGLDLLLGLQLTPCPEIGLNPIDYALRTEIHAVDQLDQAALASAGMHTLAAEIELALSVADSSAPDASEPALIPVPLKGPVAAEPCVLSDTPREATPPTPRSTTPQLTRSGTRRNTAMSTEVTASVMIGPIRPNSVHGQPSADGTELLFAPSYVLALMEGHRAAWIVQRCPNLGRPSPTLRIRPSSPDFLLAAGVLGYVALTQPRVIRESEDLRGLVEFDDRRGEVRIQPLDQDSACRIFRQLGEHAYGVATTLPGSTITMTELGIASDSGAIQIAALAPAIAETNG